MTISFDLKELHTFILVAEKLNFTSVAEKQNTVQSAVSAQIRRLESALDQRLVNRGRGQSMSLTPEGVAFLVYARRITALSEEAAETVRTSNARQILRLGTTVTLAMSLVSDALTRFARDHPNVQIQIQCDRSDQLLQRLDAGDVDLAFMMDQGRHATRRFVQSTDLLWVCGAGFKMPAQSPIPLAFLTDGRDLRRYALKALDAVSLTGHVSHLSPHPIGVRSLVQAGLALTVMPNGTIVPPLMEAPEALELPSLSSVALSAYLAEGDAAHCGNALVEHLAEACRFRKA